MFCLFLRGDGSLSYSSQHGLASTRDELTTGAPLSLLSRLYVGSPPDLTAGRQPKVAAWVHWRTVFAAVAHGFPKAAIPCKWRPGPLIGLANSVESLVCSGSTGYDIGAIDRGHSWPACSWPGRRPLNLARIAVVPRPVPETSSGMRECS